MRSIFLAGALAAALMSVPASAQWYDRGYGYGSGYGSGQRIERQINQLEREINLAADRGRITSRQERWLLRRLSEVDRLFDRYRWNGLSYNEREDLLGRLRHIRSDVYRRRDWNNGNWDHGDWNNGRGHRNDGQNWSYRYRDNDDDDDD